MTRQSPGSPRRTKRATSRSAWRTSSTNCERDPELRGRLALAVERRHDALAQTAGLNEEVFDALVLLAAGGWSPQAIARGFDKVQTLKEDMANGRQMRMNRLGFAPGEAKRLAALHTRNFM